MDAEIEELNDGTFLIIWDEQAAAWGPFTRQQLQALYEALEAWLEEMDY